MTRSKLFTRLSLLLSTALVLQTGVAFASPASTAAAEAFGLSAYDSSGAVLIVESASATASLSGGATTDTKDLVYAGAGSLVESATLHTEAQAASDSSITASLQERLSASISTPPSAWNARGFAGTSQLRALKDALTGNHLLTADAIDAEAVVACDGADLVYGTAARMSNLKLAGQTLDGIIADRPNQTYEAAGVRLIFWETSFDQATNTISVNGLHVIVPGALGVPDTHIIVSHSEATATCPQPTSSQPTSPGPLDRFEISPISNQVAGEPFSVTVTAYDANGNVKTDYSGTPVLTSDLSASTEGCGATGGDACTAQMSLGTFTNGIATVTVTAYRAETLRTLTVSDDTITANSGAFAVAPGATDHLEVSGPATATVGAPATFTVRAHDLYGNTSSYTGTVVMTSSDLSATLPAAHTFVSADAGTKDLSVSFGTAGEHTVSATDTAEPTITGSSGPASVTQTAQEPSAPTIISDPVPDPSPTPETGTDPSPTPETGTDPSPTPETGTDPSPTSDPSPTLNPSPTPETGSDSGSGSPGPFPSPTPEPSPDQENGEAPCDLVKATICGTDGADDVTDTAGDDTIVTGAGNDRITITGGTNLVRSGPGNDVITVVAGTVVVYAGAGDDIIRCAGGADRVFAGRGSDLVVCRGGDDIVVGGPGDDELHGDRGSDRIHAGAGDDVLFGRRGRDHLRGGADDDALRGGRHSDVVRGGGGNDVLFGGQGRDALRGGAGKDVSPTQRLR